VVAEVERVGQPCALGGDVLLEAEVAEDPQQHVEAPAGDPSEDGHDRRVRARGGQRELDGVDGPLVHLAQQDPQPRDGILDLLQGRGCGPWSTPAPTAPARHR
jgi:hypothetical protein